MYRYVVKRLLLMIPVLFGISFIVFSIMSFNPGDPASIILGTEATQEAIDQLNEELGFNDPFLVRYGQYVKGILKGDFGKSYRTGAPVFDEIFRRFPTTFKLALLSIILSVIIGIPIGILSAVKQYSAADYISTVIAMFLASVPQFWLGLMAILIFSLKLGWFPSTGSENWNQFILPAMALALVSAARNMRLTRSTMLETIRQDYVRTAKAKGASPFTIVFKHALMNALLPIITNVGIIFGQLLGGMVVIESVFGMQGVGTLTITAIRTKDIPQVTASLIFLAFMYSVLMLLVDIAYAFIDPRIKARYTQ